MKSKLNLNLELVDKSREAARKIALDTQEFIDKHTTVAVERTICRLLGVDGVDEFGVPLPNIVVDNIKNGNGLSLGAALFLGNAVVNTELNIQEIAVKVSKGELDLVKLPMSDKFDIRLAVNSIAKERVE